MKVTLIDSIKNRFKVYDAIANAEEKDLFKTNINIYSDVSGYILSDLELLGLHYKLNGKNNRYKLKEIDGLLKSNPKFIFELVTDKRMIRNRIAGYLLMLELFPDNFNEKDINKKINKLRNGIVKEFMILSGNNNQLYTVWEADTKTIMGLFESLTDEIKIIVSDIGRQPMRTVLSSKETELIEKYTDKYGKEELTKFVMMITNSTKDQIPYIEKVFSI